MDDFVIARNPEEGSSLPYLVRLPIGEGIVLKTKQTWPRTSKLYCHRADGWPEQPEIVERVPVRTCVRRGAAIDLVVDRGRENRSQFVITLARGREMIFWQTARTAKQARPGVRTPSARAQGIADLEILVDSHERYPWTFAGEQVTTARRALPSGDYGIERDGRLLAVVERKSLEDLVASLTSGKLRYQLAELAGRPHAAVVVEDRYSRIFALTFAKPAAVADRLAECQARFPTVPVIFAETRALAQQWTYRFLAACVDDDLDHDSAGPLAGLGQAGADRVEVAAGGTSTRPAGPAPADVRRWAIDHGFDVSPRGRLSGRVLAAYAARFGSGAAPGLAAGPGAGAVE